MGSWLWPGVLGKTGMGFKQVGPLMDLFSMCVPNFRLSCGYGSASVLSVCCSDWYVLIHTELSNGMICGNGILDTNETCDCGIDSQCAQEAQCCESGRTCRLRTGAQCG